MPDSVQARFARGVLAVAATYVFFLLYAQFGFVFLLQSRGGGAEEVQRAMGAMGLGGLAGSFLAAGALRRFTLTALLRAGFLLAAVAALLPLLIAAKALLPVVALLVGLSVAAVTIGLSSSLPALFPPGRLGFGAGLGTGLAYFLCNVPGVFSGTPAFQSVFSAAACAAGFLCAGGLGNVPRPASAVAGAGRPRLLLAGAVLCFLALVWLDSAAFAVIQRNESLKALTWQGPARQWTQGTTHLLAAILAGRVIDRFRLAWLWPVTLLLFLVALPGLQSGAPHRWNGPLYAVGISFYSTALVAYPGLSSRAFPAIGAPLRAALVYGIAGWIGSGLGVGLAQNLRVVPDWFFPFTGALVLAGWLLPRWSGLGPGARSGGALALCALAGLAFGGAPRVSAENDPVEVGRRTYIAEGCMHCHSQFVRPGHGTPDAAWWGPSRPVDRTEQPPMVGNRRQGPDLHNVGLRRSPDWLRLHFLEPSTLVHGSRMPSYAHLFAPGDPRGPGLVAYLSGRGAGGESVRWEARQAWTPAPVPAAESAPLFARHCTACHGTDGRGDGRFAAQLQRPGLNLRKGYFLYAPENGDTPRWLALARIVKFGIPGTAMAGHETLDDAEIHGLVNWLLALPADKTP